jgi:integrase
MATRNPRRKLRQDGTVAWQARYRDPDGRQRAKEFTKKVDAERFLATTRADMARGDWINPVDAKRLFADVAEHWRTTQVHADTTAAAVAGDLKNHILPDFGDEEIGRIRHSDVQAWVRRLSERLAPATVDRSYRWLAAIFRLAVNDDLIRRSPCFAIKLPAKPETKVEPLRREDVEALLNALPARYRALAVVGAGAGLRQGEAFGLTVPNVDFLRGREIRVRQQLKHLAPDPPYLGRTKTPSSVRTVPVGDTVLHALARHLELFPAATELAGYPSAQPELLVFTDERGEPLRGNRFARVWGRARSDAGLPDDVTFHDLRHYFASLLIHKGLSVKAVQEALGHKTATETLNTYGHLWPDDVGLTRRAVDEVLGPCVAARQVAGL